MNKFSRNQIISSQPHFSILFRHSEKEIIPQSHSLGIGSIVYSPIARGLLSGKYKPGHIFNEDDCARHNHHTFEDEHLEKGLRIYNILLEWIKDKGFNPTQLAIALDFIRMVLLQLFVDQKILSKQYQMQKQVKLT